MSPHNETIQGTMEMVVDSIRQLTSCVVAATSDGTVQELVEITDRHVQSFVEALSDDEMIFKESVRELICNFSEWAIAQTPQETPESGHCHTL